MVSVAFGAMMLAVAGLAVAPAEVGAQFIGGTPVPKIGQRVRIVAPTLRRDRYIGRVDGLPQDSIVLDTAGVRRRLGFEMGPVLVDEFRRVTIPTSAIQAIDISTGRTHARSTVKGMLIGALAGGAALGAANLPEINPSFRDFLDGAAIGAAVGAVAGGVIGYLLGGEKWVSFYRAGALPPR